MQKLSEIIKKILFMLGTVLTAFLMVLATIIYFSIQWMFDTWSNLTMDELVYHLTAPLEGTNEAMIQEYLSKCIAPAILILILVIILFISWYKKKRYFILMGAGTFVSLAVSASVVYGAWNQLDVGGYMKAQGTYSAFIDDNYVNPAEVSLDFPEKKRNLIYIFLESIEVTYADKENGGAFEENVIPELTKLARENEDFSGESSGLNGGYAMPGATWTMGAMFAQTSGLPLNIPIDGNSMDTQDSFFDGAIMLGDILDSVGYRQALLIGSDATFGGRRLFFSKHGDYEIYDYKYAQETAMIPEDYKVWWGYEDEKLFEFAKEKLTEFADSDRPFNFTILTVDTHPENGYVCNLCQRAFGDDQYANVIACSDCQVGKFVKWVQQQNFYEDTTIVLVGDHPTMDSDFCEDVDSDYVRKVYTTYINSAVTTETNTERNYATFDLFPTTLAALGMNIEGERLGLGTNLFSGTQTLTERFGREAEKKEIEKKSKLMEELAEIDENNQMLLMREGQFPTADMSVFYNWENGILTVDVKEIENVAQGVANVLLEIWTDEGQSDLLQVQMEVQEDSTYSIDVDIANFGYKEGDYYLKAYVEDAAGDQYVLAEMVSNIN